MNTKKRRLRMRLLSTILLSTFLLLGLPWLVRAQQESGEGDAPLKNGDIVSMVNAGIGRRVILAAVQHSPSEELDSSPEALGSLKGVGVPAEVLVAIADRVEARAKQAANPPGQSDKPIAPKGPADIQLFFTERPAEPFRELGRVSTSKYSALGRTRKREVVDEELRKQAAQMGGDAIINITEDFASVSGVVVAFEKK